MRFGFLTTAAALLAGVSAQAGGPDGAAAAMVAGIDKLAGMAEQATELVRAIARPATGDNVPVLDKTVLVWAALSFSLRPPDFGHCVN